MRRVFVRTAGVAGWDVALLTAAAAVGAVAEHVAGRVVRVVTVRDVRMLFVAGRGVVRLVTVRDVRVLLLVAGWRVAVPLVVVTMFFARVRRRLMARAAVVVAVGGVGVLVAMVGGVVLALLVTVLAVGRLLCGRLAGRDVRLVLAGLSGWGMVAMA
jgi:hypothetical protein